MLMKQTGNHVGRLFFNYVSADFFFSKARLQGQATVSSALANLRLEEGKLGVGEPDDLLKGFWLNCRAWCKANDFVRHLSHTF
jgi:hypothetical protein